VTTVRHAVFFAPESLDEPAVPDGVRLIDAPHRDLPGALEAIADGAADTLVVGRLRAAAGSLGELVRLLDWLAEAGADMIALDVGLDSATVAGRRMVGLLREVEGWSREPEGPHRRRGRPGLGSISPAIAARVVELRDRGLSLHAIASELNAAGVPTPRGGAQWRASSVQSALGYRRPRPPLPGAPPPHRRPPPPRPRHAPPPGSAPPARSPKRPPQ
jgi:hypothetical protein